MKHIRADLWFLGQTPVEAAGP